MPLGKSAFDNDDEDDDNSKTIKGIPKVKGSELDVLDEFDKHKKSSPNSKNENQASYKSRKDRTPEEEEEILDEFYPSMKHLGKDKVNQSDDEKVKKDKNGDFKGGAAKIPETSSKKETDKNMQNNIEKMEKDNMETSENEINKKTDNNKDQTLLLKTSVEKSDLKLSDQNFIDSMDVVFKNEGGFSNHKNDKGGRTNMGITQKTYDDYCKRHGREKKDVKNLTKEEAVEVYYNDYWKASGADKIDNPAGALIVFDTAVLHGVGRAKQFYKQANGDFDKIIQLRKEHYKKKVQDDPTQKDFLNGWNNRVNKLDKILKETR